MSLTRTRRDLSERVDGVVRDVAAFRVVALSDLTKQQFDGHTFAGRRGIGEAEQPGWIERQTAQGPKGGLKTSGAPNRRDLPVFEGHVRPGNG